MKEMKMNILLIFMLFVDLSVKTSAKVGDFDKRYN